MHSKLVTDAYYQRAQSLIFVTSLGHFFSGYFVHHDDMVRIRKELRGITLCLLTFDIARYKRDEVQIRSVPFLSQRNLTHLGR